MLFEHRGNRFHYRWDGRGEPLTLVHGVGGQLDAWDLVVPILAPEFRILRYDLRGHGRSDKVRGPYALADFVGDLAGLLDHAGLASTNLVGFSLGGLIIQAFALAHPSRVKKLVIMSAIAGRNEDERAKVQERLQALAERGGVSHYEASLGRWFTDEFRKAHPEEIERRRRHAEEMDPACYLAAYTVLATSDLGDELHKIKNETFIVTGENDIGSNPRMARLMHERIANSRLHIIPRLKHNLVLEAPDLVGGLLRGFLAGSAPEAGRRAV